MRFIVAVSCLLWSWCAFAVSPVGVITEAQGEVRIVRQQQFFAAAPSVDLFADDVIETGDNAFAQIELDDGSMFRLGPRTRLALSDYQLSGKNVVSATIDVLSGWIRFGVSKLRGTSRFQIRTPTLVVGIRGTGGAIEAGDEGGGLDLEEGLVDVSSVDDAAGAAPVQVKAGEYLEHRRGRALRKMRATPAFRSRVPPAVRAQLVRRAFLMKKRGVPPRLIRAMTREEAKHLLERRQLMQRRVRMKMQKRALRQQRQMQQEQEPAR